MDEDAEVLVEMRTRYKEDLKNSASRKRMRLYADQVAVMKEYFERNYVWSVETKIEIGSKIGLSLC